MPSTIPQTEPRSIQVGYCTNVHAGRDLASVIDNLTKHCLPIRNQVRPHGSLGIGLWFSEVSARQSLDSENLRQLSELLQKYQLVPFTLNGFPQGDFHLEIVKHRVYQPTWWQRERFEYTLNLIRILDQLLPKGQVGSISTLPIAWGSPALTHDQLSQASDQLLGIAEHLHQLYETTGRFITLAIEPEPGCALTDSQTLRTFFRDYLSSPRLTARQSDLTHQFLSVCHDVCHAAVMFEDQADEWKQLKAEGIAIGKVQVSSAIQVLWQSKSPQQRIEAFEQLSRFAEDRYLHQTVCKTSFDSEFELIEDLPKALQRVSNPANLQGEWRIHFHVPIYLDAIGHLGSTQPEISKLVQMLATPDMPDFVGHFELETYAWSVAPESIRTSSLNEGIAREIEWFDAQISGGMLRP